MLCRCNNCYLLMSNAFCFLQYMSQQLNLMNLLCSLSDYHIVIAVCLHAIFYTISFSNSNRKQALHLLEEFSVSSTVFFNKKRLRFLTKIRHKYTTLTQLVTTYPNEN
ncbi:hypothetical protein VNO77_30093 [Canavalia gladiata]|uniref:Uncharacterized protein n=1 Tax=Canavalia gladiata TaxID=3824 RepID=A0AAN9KP49_CANGL